mgnify:CR=1 FL=1
MKIIPQMTSVIPITIKKPAKAANAEPIARNNLTIAFLLSAPEIPSEAIFILTLFL